MYNEFGISNKAKDLVLNAEENLKEEKEIAKKIEELRCLSLTKTGYRWFKFDIDKKLGEAILKLWNTHFRAIAEAEKLKEKTKASSSTIVL